MNIVEPTPLQLALFIIQLEKTDQNVDNISNMIKEYGRRLLDYAAEKAEPAVVDKQSILKIKDEL